ncbi:MAG: VOC family protein [Pseudomonadota bacterium]
MADTRKAQTCLWFKQDAEEAAAFYVSLLPESRIDSFYQLDPGLPPHLVEFTLAGTPYLALNGGPDHALSPAISIAVRTSDQAETDRLWHALIAEGGEPGQCGWLVDRWGVSWQITPQRLIDLVYNDDREGSDRVRAAMADMGKIEIADIEALFAGRKAR